MARVVIVNREDEFVVHYPWFYSSIETRSRRIAEDVLEKRFRGLFREHACDNANFVALRDRVTSSVEAAGNSAVRRVEATANSTVRRLMDDNKVQKNIMDEVTSRYHELESEMRESFKRKERERDAHIDRVQKTQTLTFLGGAIVGAGLMFVGAKFS